MPYFKKIAKVLGFGVLYSFLRDVRIKLKGFNVLNFEETKSFLKPFQIKTVDGNEYLLPTVIDCADEQKNIFEDIKITSDPLYVWDCHNSKNEIYLSKYGSVIVGNKVLLTHRDHKGFYKDIYSDDTREMVSVPSVIAPFSHNQDENGYCGYYDYLYFVAIKISRIIQASPEVNLSDTYISYAPFGGDYEKEYLELFGLNPDNFIDSQKYKVISPRVFTANGTGWHPNLNDILSMKNLIETKFQPIKTKQNRIYISRTGRRKIINEDELISLLKNFDFEIIEDKQRTVKEQIFIYSNASFIIGPHGASFANIIWCSPGAHLFELFSSNYVPDYFVYLATIMQMEYSAYYEGIADRSVSFNEGLMEDIYVSIPKLEICLNKIFKM